MKRVIGVWGKFVSLTHGYFSGSTRNEGLQTDSCLFVAEWPSESYTSGKMIQSHHRILITCCKISVKAMADSCCGGGGNERALLRL